MQKEGEERKERKWCSEKGGERRERKIKPQGRGETIEFNEDRPHIKVRGAEDSDPIHVPAARKMVRHREEIGAILEEGAIKEVFVIFCSHLLSLAWVPKTMIEFIDREKMTHLLFQRKLDEVFSMKRRKVVGANRAMAGGILETLGAPGTKPVEYRRLRDGKGEEEEKEEVSVVLVLVKVFKRFRPVPTLRKRRQTDQSRWPSDCLQARTCSSCG